LAEILGLLQLRLRWRRELLLLELGVLGVTVLRRLPLSLLGSLVLLILIEAALLLCRILAVQLSVAKTRAWCRLWSKCLISVWTFGLLDNRGIGRVLLLIRLLLGTLVLIGAVVIYPALLLIATFGVEWGPTVLILRMWNKLLRLLLVLMILRWYLRRVGVLL
jgi:hypothetical protein